MDSLFLKTIQENVTSWSNGGYKGAKKETLNILSHIKRIGFLHKPQLNAVETYIYLKEITDNKPTVEVLKNLFTNEKELLLGLGVSPSEAFDLIGDQKKIAELMIEKFGKSDYPNQVYALTMGSGKTILMAVMMAYDFILSYYYPEDNRFAKNALVFAPDTTIIESLKEIKTFDYSRVVPKEYENVILNIKYHYLESTATELNLIGNYNVIVSNSQKIILKTRSTENNHQRLFNNVQYLEKREIENHRLQALRGLKNLTVFVDEAHHSYGKTLEGALKKVRQTIDYLHGNAPLISVVNLTGTPYVNNKMIADVVYHFGLNKGIEDGILKQVRFFEYSNVKSEGFIEDVLNKFWDEYGENRLEGKLPKIAFYASNISDLQTDLRPKIEKLLLAKGISTDKVLEFHTEAEKNKEEFVNLDSPESNKQFILLVGKGTEGWNCRSLVSCALFRKPNSSIFVLQSSTRCLRSIGDNSTRASIFLSEENYRILDKELKSNFSTTIEEISAQEQRNIEYTLNVEKKKKLLVKKVLRDYLAIQKKDLSKIKLNIDGSKKELKSFIAEGEITLSDTGEAKLKEAIVKEEIKGGSDLTYYEIIERINRFTHLPCLEISKLFELNKVDRKDLVQKVNNNSLLIPYLITQITDNAFEYEENVSVVEEEIELTKLYPFKISVEQNKKALIVYREELEGISGKSRIGFHINPYNFDSSDEKDLFKYLREVLGKDESIVDVYFTGGVTDASHNDFYFEYWNPDESKISKYFPDFLIETNKNRFLVVEVKAGKEKIGYEQNKKQYKGKTEELFNVVFAKEIGFKEFQEVNKNFEYKIVFDANLQARQQELYEMVKK